jgi:iron(III) transport system ATP-binding protein
MSRRGVESGEGPIAPRRKSENQELNESMTAAQSARIIIDGVTKVFKDDAGTERQGLAGVSLTVNPGEFTVLLGPSGCGKTTLLRCVAGLETPTSGEIEISGKTVFSPERRIAVTPERRNISMVFQSYALWPHMNLLENVAYPLRTRKVKAAEARARALEMLELVGLAHRQSAYPSELSGGQQQRVALARAIVSDSDVVLFDEPLSNLDAKVRERLRVEVVAIQRKIGFSALYVTHDQSEAMAMADTVVVMNEGVIEQVGSPVDVYERPKSRYVANFVGNVNEIEGTVVGTEEGKVAVRTALATITSVNHYGLDFRVGDEVIVGIRPEHLSLQHPGQAAGAGIGAKIVRSTFLGGLVEHELDADGTKMIVRAMATTPLADGTRVEATWSPSHVCVFPADTAAREAGSAKQTEVVA